VNASSSSCDRSHFEIFLPHRLQLTTTICIFSVMDEPSYIQFFIPHRGFFPAGDSHREELLEAFAE